MHRLAVWVCCLVLAGCQPVKSVTDSDLVEVRSQKLVAKIKLIDSTPPLTLAVTMDEEDNTSFASTTEHDCEQRVSILKYLAIFDSNRKLVQEFNVELELDVVPGSIGEAELKLACNKTSAKGMV